MTQRLGKIPKMVISRFFAGARFGAATERR
jgi:hypothetical protein